MSNGTSKRIAKRQERTHNPTEREQEHRHRRGECRMSSGTARANVWQETRTNGWMTQEQEHKRGGTSITSPRARAEAWRDKHYDSKSKSKSGRDKHYESNSKSKSVEGQALRVQQQEQEQEQRHGETSVTYPTIDLVSSRIR